MFFPIVGMMIQSDELHHFSEGLKPPTRIADGDVVELEWDMIWDMIGYDMNYNKHGIPSGKLT